MKDREYNTEAIRQLLLNAYTPPELKQLCFDHFRPVYQSLGQGQTHGQQVQELLEFVVRYGMVGLLLQLTRERNPFQYERFERELCSEPIGPIKLKQDATDDDIEQAYRLTKKAVQILERQKKRFGSNTVPARFLIELEQRRQDLKNLEEQLKRRVGQRSKGSGKD